MRNATTKTVSVAVNHGVEAYRRARQQVAADVGVTVLHVGADASQVVVGQGDDAPVVIPIRVGTATGAMPRRDPPTPLELERAIAAIEDEVMPLARRLPPSSVLVVSGGAMHELVPAAGGLALGDVEHLFQQLAAVAEGRPAASSGAPSHPASAATLLIVREFMHHLGFESLIVDGRVAG